MNYSILRFLDKNILRELKHFILNGITSALIYYIILFVLFEIFLLNEFFSIVFGVLISSLFNFFYNKKITFLSKNKIYCEIVKYLITLLISYFVFLICFKISEHFTENIYYQSFISIGVNSIIKFLLLKKYVFAKY
mgnify:CR=1 FL=1